MFLNGYERTYPNTKQLNESVEKRLKYKILCVLIMVLGIVELSNSRMAKPTRYIWAHIRGMENSGTKHPNGVCWVKKSAKVK